MIKKIIIQNYKIFNSFELELNNGLNILVGDNEVGKSTLTEAINLALTKRVNGRLLEYELTPYFFNKACTSNYLASLNSGTPLSPPKILIEIYFEYHPDLASLMGSMNSKKEDCAGLKLEIAFDEDYKQEYENLVKSEAKNIKLIPTEYYKIHWYSFADHAITVRSLPLQPSYIDASAIRLQSGTDHYLQDIIRTDLDIKERVGLTIAYRNLKESFSREEAIQSINKKLSDKSGSVTQKDLSVSLDISQKSSWESNLIPHLDELPFQLSGKGAQNALKIMLALKRRADSSNIILIEEPENHLSFSSMNTLISQISDKCDGKQIIITTHSAYVLNKLGLHALILFGSSDNNVITATLKELDSSTQDYFKKLSGYDTLRLILAKRAILVEGPSDELIAQKSYLKKHNRLPVEDGIDVINVRGLSFSRFLDIAKELNKLVSIVTDNDGNYQEKVASKYAKYSGFPNITICASEDDSLPTLENQIAGINDLKILNAVLGQSCASKEEIVMYMLANKTDCALRIFETAEDIKFPEYIESATQ